MIVDFGDQTACTVNSKQGNLPNKSAKASCNYQHFQILLVQCLQLIRNFFRSHVITDIKGAVGSADLKISKSALLSLNHHNL